MVIVYKSKKQINKRSVTKTRKISIVIIVAFIILSFVYIDYTPDATPMYRSNQLKQNISHKKNVKQIDYVDDAGIIRFASDVGYATKIVTKEEDCEIEEYYDESGLRVCRYSGYYGIKRTYDKKGNIKRVIYLDEKKNPISITLGYAMEEYEYDDKGKNIVTKYLNVTGDPIETNLYGYGVTYEYDDEGNLKRKTYVDNKGIPMITGQGYASLTKSYSLPETGDEYEIEEEYYYDEQGNPVSLSLGQNGIRKLYDDNGQTMEITYLNANGEPIVTNKGYTKIIRLLYANGNIAREQYYDINDAPYQMPEGQYGYINMGGKRVYLDINGNEKYNVKNSLHNQSKLAVIAALIVVLASEIVSKKWNCLLLFIYICIIAYLTLLFRENGNSGILLEPLWSYRKALYDSVTRSEILKNIWLFVPLGAILFRLFPTKKIVLIVVALSAIIEMIQFITGIGLCELDDVISNGLGGVAGYCMSENVSYVISTIHLKTKSQRKIIEN